MASRRHVRQRACVGKVRYPTRREARETLAELRRRYHVIDVHYYRCPYGAHFHLGHLTAQQKRIIETRR